MGGLAAKIADLFRVILAVLGIVSTYPEVTTDNIYVYKNFNNPNIINVQFRCYNLLNPSILEIVQSGIEVSIVYQVKTTVSSNEVYKNKIIKAISYDGKAYSINRQYKLDLNAMTNMMQVNELVILSNAGKYNNKLLESQVQIKIESENAPDLMNLWGNKPKIVLTFSLKE